MLFRSSEGLRKADGEPIVEPIFQVGRAVYYLSLIHILFMGKVPLPLPQMP